MKKLALLLLLISATLKAQTSVTATITDSDSQTWNNGTYIITLLNPFPQVVPSISGVPLTTAQMNLTGSMSSSGVITVTLSDNSQIVPAGTKWQFVLQPQASVQASVATATVSGASQDISTILSNQITAPRFSASPTARGYLDVEITPTPIVGGQYFNVTNNINRIWYSGAFHNNGGAGGGSVTSFSAGNFSPLFTSSVATPASTPALTFTAVNAAQNSVLAGPPSGGAGAYSFQTAPTFSAANLTNFPAAPSVTNSLTGAASGGAAAGATYNGSAPVTLDYHTLGAAQTGGANTFTGAQTAPAWVPQNTSAGPYSYYFDDYFTIAALTTAGIGSPTGNSVALSSTVTDVNHPGNFAITSGTVTSTGEQASLNGTITNVNTSLGWTHETMVYVPVLPGTTAAAYVIGMTSAGFSGASAPSGWMGWYLSSANGVANDWYCGYASTLTDSTVAATAAWVRLTMVNDGTNAHWYINGTQVCGTSVPIASLPPQGQQMGWGVTNLTASSTFKMYVDYLTWYRPVIR